MIKPDTLLRIELLLRGAGSPMDLINRLNSRGASITAGSASYTNIKKMERANLIKGYKTVSGVNARGGKSTRYILTDEGRDMTLKELTIIQKLCDFTI